MDGMVLIEECLNLKSALDSGVALRFWAEAGSRGCHICEHCHEENTYYKTPSRPKGWQIGAEWERNSQVAPSMPCNLGYRGCSCLEI